MWKTNEWFQDIFCQRKQTILQREMFKGQEVEMKKEIYVCDDCGKDIKTKEPNILSLVVGFEKYKKELCDNCCNNNVNFFTKKGVLNVH